MKQMGYPPPKWALYVYDEPFPGEDQRVALEFIKTAKQYAPDIQLYLTLANRFGDMQQAKDIAEYVDYIQTFKPWPYPVKNMWHYSIQNRGSSPFQILRNIICAASRRNGFTGTGFWVWDGHTMYGRDGTHHGVPELWIDKDSAFFPVLYTGHNNQIIPSLRADAFREGIEDWKYVIMLNDAVAILKAGGEDAKLVAECEAYIAREMEPLQDSPETIGAFRKKSQDYLLKLHAALGTVTRDEVAAAEGR